MGNSTQEYMDKQIGRWTVRVGGGGTTDCHAGLADTGRISSRIAIREGPVAYVLMQGNTACGIRYIHIATNL